MADHDFTIRFRVDRADSLKAHSAEAAAYRQRVKEANDAAKAIAKASAEEAAARKKAAKEATDAAKAAEKQAAREMADAAKEAAKQARNAERDAAQARRKESADLARAIAQDARNEAASRREVIRIVRAAEREANAARKAEAREAATVQRAAQAEAAKAAREAAKAQAEAAKEQEAGWEKLKGFASGFVGVLGAASGISFGLGAVTQILGEVSDAFARARERAEEATNFAEGYRDALKEIAFLKGQNAPTAGTVKGSLDSRARTLQGQEADIETQTEFLNAAAISIDVKDPKGNVVTKKKMSAEDAERMREFAGRTQARMGGEAGPYGALMAGVVAMESGAERVSPELAERRYMQVLGIGQAGRASGPQFSNQMAMAQGMTQVGSYRDMARMAAVGSLVSLENPAKINEGLGQLQRMTLGGMVDPTGGPGSETSPKEYLKGIGATDQMDVPDILQLMFKDVEGAEAKAAKGGKKLNVLHYLSGKGYGNQEDIQRFMGAYGNRKSMGFLMDMAANMPTLEEAEAPNKAFAISPAGQAAARSVQNDRVTASIGLSSGEYAKAIKQQAFESMQARDPTVTGSYEHWKDSRRLRDEVIEIQRDEMTRLGMDVKRRASKAGETGWYKDPLQHLYGGWFSGRPGTDSSDDLIYQNAGVIAEAGGDPYGNRTGRVQAAKAFTNKRLQGKVESEDKMTAAMARSLDSIDRKLNPAPIQVAPPGGDNRGRHR